MKYQLLTFLCFVFITACTDDETAPVVLEDSGQSDSVSYSQDIVPIVQTYCYGSGDIRCHVPDPNQATSSDFTTYDGLKQQIENGLLQIKLFGLNPSMPPSGFTQLPDTCIEKFKIWVDEGYPYN